MNHKKIRKIKSVNLDLQRKVVAHMTSLSWKNIPHVGYHYEPDITTFYEKTKNQPHIAFNSQLLKIMVEALKAAPELNGILDYNDRTTTGTLHVLKEINISLPWTLEDGRMITPVISNCEDLSLESLNAETIKLAKKIKNTNIDELLYKTALANTVTQLKSLKFGCLFSVAASKISKNPIKGLSGQNKKSYYQIPSHERLTENDLLKGTVTISNIGSLYKGQKGAFTLLEIIPPQVFAIGIGAIQEKPGVFINQFGRKDIGIRKTLPLCLAFDHRAFDFNTVVPFLKKLDELFK